MSLRRIFSRPVPVTTTGEIESTPVDTEKPAVADMMDATRSSLGGTSLRSSMEALIRQATAFDFAAGKPRSIRELMGANLVRAGDRALQMISETRMPEAWQTPVGQGLLHFAFHRYALVAQVRQADGEFDTHLQSKLAHAASVLWQMNAIVESQENSHGSLISKPWRLLLEYAALLHDVGYIDGGYRHSESGARDMLFDMHGPQRLQTLNRILSLKPNASLRRGALNVEHLAQIGNLNGYPYANLVSQLQVWNQTPPTDEQLRQLESELPPYQNLNDFLKQIGAPPLTQEDLEKLTMLVELHGTAFPWDRIDNRLPGEHYVDLKTVTPIFEKQKARFVQTMRQDVATNAQYLQRNPNGLSWMQDPAEVMQLLKAGWLLHSADNFNGAFRNRNAVEGDQPLEASGNHRLGRQIAISSTRDLNDFTRRHVVGQGLQTVFTSICDWLSGGPYLTIRRKELEELPLWARVPMKNFRTKLDSIYAQALTLNSQQFEQSLLQAVSELKAQLPQEFLEGLDLKEIHDFAQTLAAVPTGDQI